jgi:ArsR family transcriptional regulator, arsenate/arsenite/antimonite-responsive transcriptional repressor
MLQSMATMHRKVKLFLDNCWETLQLTDMDEKTLLRYELRAEMFKALAHPMRILMLEKLRTRPWCVCELADEVGLEKSVASKHLSQLKSVGLIADEKRGTLVEYRLVAPCILDMAACAEGTVLENRRKLLAIASGD